MSTEENKALVRREIEELFNHTGDLDVAGEVYAPDFVGHDPTLPEDLHGVEAARQFAASFRGAFPDLTCTIEDQLAEGDKVVSRWTARGTHQGDLMGIAPTGKSVTVTGFDEFRVADGKIAELWQEVDMLGLMQQLGALPAPAAAA